MRNKFLIVIGAFSLAVMLTLNITLVRNDSNADFSLGSLLAIAQTLGETPPPPPPPCWTATILACPSLWGMLGGSRQKCTATGSSGPPYSCLETDCQVVNPQELTKTCIH